MGSQSGVRHVGNQYIACLNAIHFTDIINDFYTAGPNALADGAALYQNFSTGMQGVAFHGFVCERTVSGRA